MPPAWLSHLQDVLDQPDPPELIRRGHRLTQAGWANRRSTVFLPLLVRWAQVRYVAKDAPPHLGKAKKGFNLRIADRRRRA